MQIFVKTLTGLYSASILVDASHRISSSASYRIIDTQGCIKGTRQHGGSNRYQVLQEMEMAGHHERNGRDAIVVSTGVIEACKARQTVSHTTAVTCFFDSGGCWAYYDHKGPPLS